MVLNPLVFLVKQENSQDALPLLLFKVHENECFFSFLQFIYSMQRFVLLLSLGLLLLTACQNTPKSASEPAPGAETAAPQVAPVAEETINQTLSQVNSSKDLVLSIRKELDALPASIKNKNKEAIGLMYNDLEGLLEKEAMMSSELQRASSGGKSEGGDTESVPTVTLDPATVKDYSESIERYNQLLKEMQEKAKAMKGGN